MLKTKLFRNLIMGAIRFIQSFFMSKVPNFFIKTRACVAYVLFSSTLDWTALASFSYSPIRSGTWLRLRVAWEILTRYCNSISMLELGGNSLCRGHSGFFSSSGPAIRCPITHSNVLPGAYLYSAFSIKIIKYALQHFVGDFARLLI